MQRTRTGRLRRRSTATIVSLAAVLVLAAMSVVVESFSSPRTTNVKKQRVAFVTGGNKGIGFEIARMLGLDDKNGTAHVVLGCRDEGRGREAASKLRDEIGRDTVIVDVVRIDLEDPDGAEAAAEEIRSRYGRLDVLVNNAAVCFNDPTLYGRVPHTPFEEQAEITVRTNFFGTLALTRAMLPLLDESDSPRIVNVASSAGRLSILPSEKRRRAFSSEDLTMEKLEGYMNEFVSDARDGAHSERGWPNTGYGVSKAGIIAMTKIMAKEHPTMMVNSVDPGYCRTDQNNNQGVVPAERGALTPYLLSTLPDDQFYSGLHWYEGKVINWSYQ